MRSALWTLVWLNGASLQHKLKVIYSSATMCISANPARSMLDRQGPAMCSCKSRPQSEVVP